MGLQLNWNAIPGLHEALEEDSVVSNYSHRHVSKTFRHISSLQSGNAIFTYPPTVVKCAGAPQKIMYLAEHNFRNRGVRGNINVMFNHAGEKIFSVPKYAARLVKICDERNIVKNFGLDLIAVHHKSKEAVFKQLKTGDDVIMKYDLMHVTPHMGPVSSLINSPISDLNGWVDVDPATLQHRL